MARLLFGPDLGACYVTPVRESDAGPLPSASEFEDDCDAAYDLANEEGEL